MEARHAARRGRDGLRGPAERHVGRRLRATTRRASSATSSPRRSTFYTSETVPADADGKLAEDRDARQRERQRPPRPAAPRAARATGRSAGRTYPAGALLAADFDDFLDGERALRRALRADRPQVARRLQPDPQPRRSSTSSTTCATASTCSRRKDGTGRAQPLPGMPRVRHGRASSGGRRRRVGRLLPDRHRLPHADEPLPRHASARARRSRSSSCPAFFDAKGLAVSQHEVASKDGTRVPYFQVAREGPRRSTATNPTLLYGYGGFEISMTPGYSGGVGAAWLEQGGVYVVANIRGGGEFGPKWHQAALKENRHRAYEDFIAVAEDLIARKVTSPQHLGIQGGSQRRPADGQHAHACGPTSSARSSCQVPLLDMRRYHKLLAGASWMARVRQPRRPEGVGVHRELLALPQREGRREVSADAVHDLDPRRPRASRPRPQDGGAHARRRGTTSSTTRTSRAATAAPPTTSRRPTCTRWPTRSCGRSCPESARRARSRDPWSVVPGLFSPKGPTRASRRPPRRPARSPPEDAFTPTPPGRPSRGSSSPGSSRTAARRCPCGPRRRASGTR